MHGFFLETGEPLSACAFLWERLRLLLILLVSDSYKSIDLILSSASLVQRKILRHNP